MNLEEVYEIANHNEHLIGKTINGKTIDELLIHPINRGVYNIFLNTYYKTLNNQEALQPFLNEELGIKCVLDKSNIEKSSIISTLTLEEANQLL